MENTKESGRSACPLDTSAILPSRDELDEIFLQKYGQPESAGWGPRRRHRFRYFLPSDIYEATVKKLITDDCRWLDAGGGHQIFPENPELARILARRCDKMMVVDPSDNTRNHKVAHEIVQCRIEDYSNDTSFDLCTIRMVAEHVENPILFVQAIYRLLKPGGLAIVFTVNRFAPIAIISRLTPFFLHYPIKRYFWGGQEKDTFPTCYKMNTRATLRALFTEHGFRERSFSYLDDCSAFGKFYVLNYCELQIIRVFKRLSVRYPENCLLGVYQKV